MEEPKKKGFYEALGELAENRDQGVEFFVTARMEDGRLVGQLDAKLHEDFDYDAILPRAD